MAASENVVPFPKRRDPRWEDIRTRLINSVRLEKAEPPLLASNLGRMAGRLDPVRPQDAARRMFQTAFGEHWEAHWRKRQRLVRLPGEASPPFERAGEYESGGAKYVHLAEAFAKLRGGNAPEDRDAAIRSLTRGTPLNPDQALSPSDLDGPQRAVVALQRLSKQASDSDTFARAFEILRSHPIDNDGGRISLFESTYPALTSEYIHDKYVPMDRGLHWSIPRVEVGHIFLPLKSACMELGPIEAIGSSVDSEDVERAKQDFEKVRRYRQSASADDMEAEISQNALLSRALKSLRERLPKFGLGVEPFRAWNFHDDIGQHEAPARCRLHLTMARYKISLCLWPSTSAGEIEVRIIVADDRGDFFADFVLTYGDRHIDLFGPESIGEADDGELECGLVVIDGQAYAVASFDVRFNMNYANMTGFNGIHRLDADEATELLLMGSDGERIFEPTIWDDRSRFAPAPQVSMVSTILRNLAYANDEDRLDNLLLADAERRLKPVVQFYEAQRAAFDDALDQRD